MDGRSDADRQRRLLEEFDLRKRASSVPVPTDPSLVSLWLRGLDEPILLFAESPAQRRERLGMEVVRRGGLDALPHLAALVDFPRPRDGPKADMVLGKYRADNEDAVVGARHSIAKYWYSKRHEPPVEGSRLPSAIELAAANPVGDRPSTCISALGNAMYIGDRDGAVYFTDRDSMETASNVRLGSPISHLSASLAGLLCALHDGTIHFVRGAHEGSFRYHSSRTYQVDWHPSADYFVSCSADSKWSLWNVHRDKSPVLSHRGHHPEHGIRSICIEPTQGALCVTGGGDAAARVWDLRAGRCIMSGAEHGQPIISASFLCPHLLATGGMDNQIIGWDLRRVSSSSFVLPAHTGPVTGLRAVSPHCFASCSMDGTVRLWRSHDGKPLAAVSIASKAPIIGMCSVAADQMATCGFDKTVRLWSIR